MDVWMAVDFMKEETVPVRQIDGKTETNFAVILN
jgi:hypothetical protein